MSNNILPDDLPKTNIHVLTAVLIVLVICSLLYFVDFKIVEHLPKDAGTETTWTQHLLIFRAVLENLIAGALGALILALTFRWVIAFIDPREKVIEVKPGTITSRLKENAKQTKSYVFTGNTATFVTSTVLPILIDIASKANTPHRIELYLIDPIDNVAVSSYVTFKSQMAQSKSKVSDQTTATWIKPLFPITSESHNEVIAKLVAAIYLAAFASTQSSIQVTVFLRRSFTPFRADITEKEVVVTQESKDEPAVAFSSNGKFHSWYYKEAEAQQAQAVKLDFMGRREDILKLNLNCPGDSESKIRYSIRCLLSSFDYLKPLAIRNDIVYAAATRVARPSHSY